ncbi:hypothetical protein [Janibacter melonis]|uniref:hypothetical protein n=1 Tax=Janibacter melonis TaxID=262209 RepID=UPI00191B893B|nr:hypothetical protein [Janibacter melonis]
MIHICACCTVGTSPDWVIYDTDDGIGWRRRPVDLPLEEEIDAPRRFDGHADPAHVLEWLQGERDHPWTDNLAGEDTASKRALKALRRWISTTPPAG